MKEVICIDPIICRARQRRLLTRPMCAMRTTENRWPLTMHQSSLPQPITRSVTWLEWHSCTYVCCVKRVRSQSLRDATCSSWEFRKSSFHVISPLVRWFLTSDFVRVLFSLGAHSGWSWECKASKLLCHMPAMSSQVLHQQTLPHFFHVILA